MLAFNFWHCGPSETVEAFKAWSWRSLLQTRLRLAVLGCGIGTRGRLLLFPGTVLCFAGTGSHYPWESFNTSRKGSVTCLPALRLALSLEMWSPPRSYSKPLSCQNNHFIPFLIMGSWYRECFLLFLNTLSAYQLFSLPVLTIKIETWMLRKEKPSKWRNKSPLSFHQ